MGGDLVALWEVRLSDGVHKVGFEHGTTTGRRVLWVDGEVSGECVQLGQNCDIYNKMFVT